MKKGKVLIWVLVAVVMAAAGGGIAWWVLQTSGKPDAATEFDRQEYKYVSLDKVIVMLRGDSSGVVTHYLSVDLVFKTPIQSEKKLREHLPLLRSMAVKALAEHSMEAALQMSVEQYSTRINEAFVSGYQAERLAKPFTEAMIGKLIIE